jgi:hypothetical protein
MLTDRVCNINTFFYWHASILWQLLICYSYSSLANKIQKDFQDGKFELSEEEKNRKMLMNLQSPYKVTSAQLKEIIEKQDNDILS